MSVITPGVPRHGVCATKGRMMGGPGSGPRPRTGHVATERFSARVTRPEWDAMLSVLGSQESTADFLRTAVAGEVDRRRAASVAPSQPS